MAKNRSRTAAIFAAVVFLLSVIAPAAVYAAGPDEPAAGVRMNDGRIYGSEQDGIITANIIMDQLPTLFTNSSAAAKWYSCADNSFGLLKQPDCVHLGNTLTLTPDMVKDAKGDTSYFVCVTAGGPYRFALTVVDEPSLTLTANTPDGDNLIQPATALTGVTLNAEWNPPVLQDEVTGYSWSLTDAPGYVHTDKGTMDLSEDVSVDTVQPVISITKVEAAGDYDIRCVAIGTNEYASGITLTAAPEAARARTIEAREDDSSESGSQDDGSTGDSAGIDDSSDTPGSGGSSSGTGGSESGSEDEPAVAPTLSASITVAGSDEPYAAASGGTVCSADVLSDAQLTLAVSAQGGTGSEENPYMYSWYQCDSAEYTVPDDVAPITSGDKLLPRLIKPAEAAGESVYYLCRVRVEDSEAYADQKFALRTVAPKFEVDSAATSSNEKLATLPLAEPISGITLAAKWDPPMTPDGTEGYSWSIVSGPKDGSIETQAGTIYSRRPLTTESLSLQIRKVNVAGSYLVRCTQSGQDGLSKTNYVEYKLTAGAPKFDVTTPFYGTQTSDGDVSTWPSRRVENGTITLERNTRFSLYIPGATFGMPTLTDPTYSVEWQFRTSDTGAVQQVPSGYGFYGVESTTLVSGPVTADMNGWQFRMQVTCNPDPTLVAYSDWVKLSVKQAPVITPNVTISSTPQYLNGLISVGTGGTVVLEANVTNKSEFHLSNLCYQWYAAQPGGRGVAIEGATDSVYTIENVTTALEGTKYWCEAFNRGYLNETGETRQLTLSVNSENGTVVFSQPVAPSIQMLETGSGEVLTADASVIGGGSVRYQWQRRVRSGNFTGITTVYDAQRVLSDARTQELSSATDKQLSTGTLQAGVYEFACKAYPADNASRSLTSASFYLVVATAITTPTVLYPTEPVTYVGGVFGQGKYLECNAYIQDDSEPLYQWQTARSANGPWTDLDGFTAPEMRISSLTEQNNGQFYRCQVTNPRTHAGSASGAYCVAVWDATATPIVASNPTSVEYSILTGPTDTGTSPDTAVYMESTAWVESGAPLYSQWQFQAAGTNEWINVPSQHSSGSNSFTGISGGTAQNGRSRLTLQANADEWAPSGFYRCVWTSGRETRPDTMLPPTAESQPARLDLLFSGHPRIVNQTMGAEVEVGNAASFTVDIRIDENCTPVYVWQMSRDGGKTWNNCITGVDGTGQYTNTFMTYAATKEMYEENREAMRALTTESAFMYRCIVANRDLSIAAVSMPAPLVIEEEEPGNTLIIPGAGSPVIVTRIDGVKYAKGIQATGNGTTALDYLDRLDYKAPSGYSLVLRTAAGDPVDDGAIMTTGMRLMVMRDKSSEVMDTVEVVIMGDLNGTGKAELSQVVAIAEAYKEKRTLTGPFLQAALLVGGTQISLSDVVAEARIYRQASNQAT